MIDNGSQIPDSEIYGLLVLCKINGLSNPVALKILIDKQTVYYYCLSDEDTEIINKNKMLWKDWYRRYQGSFKPVFKKYNDELLPCTNMPMPKISIGYNVFGTDENIEK